MAYSHTTFADALEQLPAIAHGELPSVLALSDDIPLIERLEAYNHTGRPPYQARAMWRAVLTKYLLGIRYNVELVALLRANPAIRDACGFTDHAPNESIVCRFFKRLTHHQDLVEAALARLVDRVVAAIAERKDERQPAPGRFVALDSTDIPGWVDVSRKPYSDPQAQWGVRTTSKNEEGKVLFRVQNARRLRRLLRYPAGRHGVARQPERLAPAPALDRPSAEHQPVPADTLRHR